VVEGGRDLRGREPQAVPHKRRAFFALFRHTCQGHDAGGRTVDCLLPGQDTHPVRPAEEEERHAHHRR